MVSADGLWPQTKASPGFPDARLLRSNRRDDLALSPMDSEDLEIREDDGKQRRPVPGDERKRGLPMWPWLVVLGLLAIAAGVIGPLLQS